MSLPNVAAVLRCLHISVQQQQEMAKAVIHDPEKVRAEFRSLTVGVINPLVNRALGNCARGIKLRAGAWLLAQAGGSLTECVRVIGVCLPQQPADGERKPEPSPDERGDRPNRRRNQRLSSFDQSSR